MTEFTKNWESYRDGVHADAVEYAMTEIAAADTDSMLNYLGETVTRYKDVPYSKISSRGDSEHSVVAVICPYANGLETHHLLSSLLLRRTLERAEVRDSNGDKLAVVTLPAPTRGWSPNIKNGVDPLDAAADAYNEVLQGLGYGRVAITGFSYAGSVAMAMANRPNTNMDFIFVSAADPSNNIPRTRLALFKDMLKAGPKEMLQTMSESKLSLYMQVFLGEVGDEKNLRAAGEQAKLVMDGLQKVNRRHLLRSLGKSSLYEHVEGAIKAGAVTAVSVGRDSVIARPEIVKTQLGGVDGFASMGRLNVVPGDHTWGNKPELWVASSIDNIRPMI